MSIFTGYNTEIGGELYFDFKIKIHWPACLGEWSDTSGQQWNRFLVLFDDMHIIIFRTQRLFSKSIYILIKTNDLGLILHFKTDIIHYIYTSFNIQLVVILQWRACVLGRTTLHLYIIYVTDIHLSHKPKPYNHTLF